MAVINGVLRVSIFMFEWMLFTYLKFMYLFQRLLTSSIVGFARIYIPIVPALENLLALMTNLLSWPKIAANFVTSAGRGNVKIGRLKKNAKILMIAASFVPTQIGNTMQWITANCTVNSAKASLLVRISMMPAQRMLPKASVRLMDTLKSWRSIVKNLANSVLNCFNNQIFINFGQGFFLSLLFLVYVYVSFYCIVTLNGHENKSHHDWISNAANAEREHPFTANKKWTLVLNTSPFSVRYSASTKVHHACLIMNTDMGTLI